MNPPAPQGKSSACLTLVMSAIALLGAANAQKSTRWAVSEVAECVPAAEDARSHHHKLALSRFPVSSSRARLCNPTSSGDAKRSKEPCVAHLDQTFVAGALSQIRVPWISLDVFR